VITTQLPALVVMLPLVAAPLCVIFRSARFAYALTLLTSLLVTYCAYMMLGDVVGQPAIRYAVGGWEAPTGIEFYIDTLSAAMVLLVSGISTMALIYAYHSVNKFVETDRHYLFYAAWLLCMTGLIGMVITGDAFNVFVFLEISSLSTYMLIAFGDNRRALMASFGIGFLYAATGSLNMIDLSTRIAASDSPRAVLVAFSFLTIGMMIKAAVFPLHGWLANAYQTAPTAVTVFLAGTATKVSLYVLLRFFFSIFGTEYSFGQMLLSSVLLPAAVAGFLVMSLVAVFQTDLRRMLAYSSVAQIGYIVAGISLVSEAGVTAGIVHMINHAMVKSALFMAVGCIIYRVGHCHAPSLEQLIKQMPLTVVAFIIAGLALVGVPLTVGFVSKFTLIGAAMERGWWLMAALGLVSSLMAVVYIGRVIEVMLFRRARVAAPEVELHEAPLMMLLPMYLLVGASVYFGLYGERMLGIAGEAAQRLLGGY